MLVNTVVSYPKELFMRRIDSEELGIKVFQNSSEEFTMNFRVIARQPPYSAQLIFVEMEHLNTYTKS